jgi:CheY-like chemotaxis protein
VTASSGSSLRVLIVEDHDDAARMLVDALTASGHDVRVARDGATALDICRAFTPAVALLDIDLPVMNGYILAERLRELPGMAAVHVIAITGYGERRRSRVAGFDRHLVKPIDLDELNRILNARAVHADGDAD